MCVYVCVCGGCSCVCVRAWEYSGVGVIFGVRVRSGCLCTPRLGCATGVKQWSPWLTLRNFFAGWFVCKLVLRPTQKTHSTLATCVYQLAVDGLTATLLAHGGWLKCHLLCSLLPTSSAPSTHRRRNTSVHAHDFSHIQACSLLCKSTTRHWRPCYHCWCFCCYCSCPCWLN